MLETPEIREKMKKMKASRPDCEYRSLGDNLAGRDNQQERLWLTWLTAMLECEGTFTFQYQEQLKDGRMHSHIQPRVIFVNSDMKLIGEVERVSSAMGFVPWRRDGFTSGMGRKLKSELQWNGFKGLPLLKSVRPFVVGEKAEVVDCLIEFIEYRQQLQSEGRPKQRYGEYEFRLLARVRQLNSGHWNRSSRYTGVSSQTVRRLRHELRDGMIQSGLHGDMQSVAEMTTPLCKQA